MITPINLDQLQGFVENKSVAVVGNAPDILDQKHGPTIDDHDIVIRMNAGVLGINEKATPLNIGRRTDALTVGRLHFLRDAYLAGCRPRQLWWFKLTKLGIREKQWMLHERDRQTGLHFQEAFAGSYLFTYPKDLELRVHERVGSSPTTGIRVLDMLENDLRPSTVSVFGINWFGSMGGSKFSWYKQGLQPPVAVHSGANEHRAFLSMGFKEATHGHWIRSDAGQ